MKRLYPEYVFDVVPIVIDATGYIDTNFNVHLEKLDVVNLKNVLKIVKSFMKMLMSESLLEQEDSYLLLLSTIETQLWFLTHTS